MQLLSVIGLSRTVRIKARDTIAALKDKIFRKDGTPPQYQRLVFAMRQLDDSRTLLHYGICHGNTVHLVKAARTSVANTETSPEKNIVVYAKT